MPKVSVIIPAYNGARFLPEAIESVLAQTYKDYEITIIDDGSTDNTKEILKPYFDRIQYIYQQNLGEAGARNTGIRHSQGEYIAFLDADDVWLPEKLQIQVDYLDNNPEVALVYSRPLWMSEDGRLLTGKKSRHRNLPSGDVFNILFLRCFITPSTVMVRKRSLNTVGLFDESLMISTDWDFWLKIAREFKVSGIDKYLCKYRLTPGSLSRKNIETMFKFQKRIIEKHYKMSQDSGRPIAPALYKKTLARLFFRIGKHNLKLGKRDAALKNFLESLKYKPFNLRSIKYVLKTFILCKFFSNNTPTQHFNWDKLFVNKKVEAFLASDELWGENQCPDNLGRLAWRKYLKDKISDRKIRLLEIGFGSGIDYKTLEEEGVLDDNKIEYFGVDVTKKFVEYALQHFTKMKPFLSDGYHLPFENKYFDVVYLRHVLEHQTHYRPLLSEVFRVCRGEVFINFFIELSHNASDIIHFDGTWHHNAYSRKLFYSFVNECGFEPYEKAIYRKGGKTDAIVICAPYINLKPVL